MSLSPAERYALSRQQRRQPRLQEFAANLSFDLDPFQRTACGALDEGRSPGAGIVATFGVFHLDHIGAEIGQHLARPGARKHAGELNHANA